MTILDIPMVIGTGLTNYDGPHLHIYCEAGHEQRLLDSLPFWITSLGRPYVGHRQVLIELHLHHCNGSK